MNIDPIEEERPVTLSIQLPAELDSDCDVEKKMANLDSGGDHERQSSHDGLQGVGIGIGAASRGYHRKFKNPAKAVVGGVQKSSNFAKGRLAQSMQCNNFPVCSRNNKNTKEGGAVIHDVE